MAQPPEIPKPPPPPDAPPGDGTPGEDDWLGGLWKEETLPRWQEESADGQHPAGSVRPFYVPRSKRLWSLKKCGTVLFGMFAISDRVPTRDGPRDALDFMTEEWTEDDYGFDRPMTLHLVRATLKSATVNAHEEFCTYHFGHIVVGGDGFDHLEFCYKNDPTGDYMDPGYLHLQGDLPNEVDGTPVADADVVNTGERVEFMIDPLTEEKYIEAGEECFVASMRHPNYFAAWMMDQAVYCSRPN